MLRRLSIMFVGFAALQSAFTSNYSVADELASSILAGAIENAKSVRQADVIVTVFEASTPEGDDIYKVAGSREQEQTFRLLLDHDRQVGMSICAGRSDRIHDAKRITSNGLRVTTFSDGIIRRQSRPIQYGNEVSESKGLYLNFLHEVPLVEFVPLGYLGQPKGGHVESLEKKRLAWKEKAESRVLPDGTTAVTHSAKTEAQRSTQMMFDARYRLPITLTLSEVREGKKVVTFSQETSYEEIEGYVVPVSISYSRDGLAYQESLKRSVPTTVVGSFKIQWIGINKPISPIKEEKRIRAGYPKTLNALLSKPES